MQIINICYMCYIRKLGHLWSTARVQHEEERQRQHLLAEIVREQRQTPEGRCRQRQRKLYGRCSQFSVGNIVFYHWAVEANASLQADGRYYRSTIVHVSYCRSRQRFRYIIASGSSLPGRQWITNGIYENHNSLCLEVDIPEGAQIGVDP
jgi:hypothetical protein